MRAHQMQTYRGRRNVDRVRKQRRGGGDKLSRVSETNERAPLLGTRIESAALARERARIGLRCARARQTDRE